MSPASAATKRRTRPPRPSLASPRGKARRWNPTPWHGPKRGFSFVREVQPVLDKYCVGCHDGQAGPAQLRRPDDHRHQRRHFPLAQVLHRTASVCPAQRPEGDYHTLTPLEFHADTSLLVQMLRKGHHNVKLDAEAWDRLITWIDLNVPAYGTYPRSPPHSRATSRSAATSAKKKYADVDEDIEAIPNPLPKRRRRS